MRTKHFHAAMCLGVVFLLSGCSLALEEAPSQPGQDRLAGIFVTDSYIEPGTPEIELNSRGELSIKDTGPEKRYGTLNERNDLQNPPVIFPGLEGYGIYYLQLPETETQEALRYYTSDNFLTDLHFSSSDDGDTAEASLYVSSDRQLAYYFNPVYQQEDGRVYLLPGSGVSSESFVNGQKFSHSISQSIERNLGGEETTESYHFTIRIIAAEVPGEAELFFMDQDNQVIQALSPKQLEELYQSQIPQLELPANISYLILHQAGKDGAPGTHLLFDRNTDYLEYMVSAENGLLYQRQLPLVWQ